MQLAMNTQELVMDVGTVLTAMKPWQRGLLIRSAACTMPWIASTK